MGVTELPFEILTRISDHLSKDDKLSCALTCKTWRYPFQKAMWKNIRFYSHADVKTLINIVKSPQNLYTSYGSWVHSLRISCYYKATDISDIKFSGLFKFLPNIKSLNLGNISYEDIGTGIARSDKIWKFLENLKINYKGTSEKKPAKPLFELINACSMLRKLEIYDGGWLYRAEFSVNDFDRMHQHLKNLSSINAGIYLSSDFSAMLDAIPNTTPALSVTSLDLDSKQYEDECDEFNESRNDWNPLWLYYFGYKYPNLRSLNIQALDIRGDKINSDQRQTMISLFRSNPNAFRHLEKFSITTDRYFESSDLVLWELLCSVKVPLKKLSIHATSNGKVDRSSPMNVDRILQAFSETLESLSLSGFIYSSDGQNSIIKLSSYYPVLTNLSINGGNVSLNLDDLLDMCVALKTLQYCGGNLLIGSSTVTRKSKHRQHGLITLSLEKCYTASRIFSHISFRCRSLKRITFDTLNITGSISDKTGCLLIEMPHTFLKILQIARIQYATSYQEMDGEDAINLTLLTQLNEAPLPDKKTGRKKNKVNSKKKVAESHNREWLYTYDVREFWTVLGRDTAQVYDEEEIEFIDEYYRDFRASASSTTSKDYMFYNEERDEQGWIHELDRGYGKFVFGNIKGVEII